MKLLFFQLAIFLTISVIGGLILHPFIAGFTIAAGTQWIGFILYQKIIDIYITIKAREFEVRLAEEYSKQSLEVECPCSRKLKAQVPILLNAENRYKCPGCDKDIKVIISAETVLVTTPLVNTDTTDLANYKL
jgi:hypothetical protein